MHPKFEGNWSNFFLKYTFMSEHQERGILAAMGQNDHKFIRHRLAQVSFTPPEDEAAQLLSQPMDLLLLPHLEQFQILTYNLKLTILNFLVKG